MSDWKTCKWMISFVLMFLLPLQATYASLLYYIFIFIESSFDFHYKKHEFNQRWTCERSKQQPCCSPTWKSQSGWEMDAFLSIKIPSIRYSRGHYNIYHPSQIRSSIPRSVSNPTNDQRLHDRSRCDYNLSHAARDCRRRQCSLHSFSLWRDPQQESCALPRY
jgi:hypothetical protein